VSQDTEQLEILAIFHYILAAMAALVSFFPLLQLLMGLGMIAGRFGERHPDPFSLMMGWFFALFASVAIACGFGMAIALGMAGRYLRRHERYTFCLVVACVACLFLPFGTILGVVTLLVLLRPSIKQLFGVAPPAPEDAAP
jgi:hypothetical protein